MQNVFPHIDSEYYVFLHLTKNSKSDVDQRGHRLRFLHDASPRFGQSDVVFCNEHKTIACQSSAEVLKINGIVAFEMKSNHFGAVISKTLKQF